MKIAFAGLRHAHIYDLVEMVKGHKEFTIVGGFEENEDARTVACERGIDCHYETYDSLLLDQRAETVVLGGCYGDRGQMAIQALRAGKHVIADKPLCTSLEELNEIERIAKEKNKIVSCMLTMRFEPTIHAVKKLVQDGELGEINNVYVGGQHPLMYGRRPMWYFEEGKHGGVINDIAIHCIDILKFMLGLEIQTVNAARCWNKFAKKEPTFKDSAQFMLTAKNGAGILGDMSYAIPDGIEFELPYYWQFYIWGTKGSMEFALRDKEMVYYKEGKAGTEKIALNMPQADYLSDFLKVTAGESDVIVPMQEVLDATRQTLWVQQEAEQYG